MGEILYGNGYAQAIRDHLKKEIETGKRTYARAPFLAVIAVGKEPGTLSYIKGIQKAAASIGVEVGVHLFDEACQQKELETQIEQLNQDETVDGMILQLPLPAHLHAQALADHILPEKDMDGIHWENIARLYRKQQGFVPCTPEGVIALLKQAGIEIEGKEAVILGRSDSVGRPLAQMMLNEQATVTICHSRTRNTEKICQRADIVIAAIGKARFVKADMIREGAVVIDVGVNTDESGKLCGDVDIEQVLPKAAYVTPTVKGVGSMTTAMLLEHTVRAWKRRMGWNTN